MGVYQGFNQEIQDDLQEACCYNLCPVASSELNDDQFYAVVFYFLQLTFGGDFSTVGPDEVKAVAESAWCEVNMDILCSIPPDKLKAMILYIIETQLGSFSGRSQAIQDALQEACCYDLCPVAGSELEDNEFLAMVFFGLIKLTATDFGDVSGSDIRAAAESAWCEVNMDTMCSVPPDKIKAMILYDLQFTLT